MSGNVRWILYGIVFVIAAVFNLTGCQNLGALPTLENPASITAPPLTATITLTSTPTLTYTPPAPPTLIPQEPPATRPALPCRDGLTLVMDLSYAAGSDGTLPLLPANSQMEKGWRVHNTGTCIWDSAYILLPGTDTPDWATSSQSISLESSVQPGEMFDFWVNLTAPRDPGVYQAEWRLHNGRGRNFGDRLTMDFEVVDRPTETPLPDVYLVAEPLEVFAGEPARIAWSTRQAKSAYFFAVGQTWQEHPVELTGSTVVLPERTTTYELRVVNGDDTIESRRITIEVLPFEPPRIRIFQFEPKRIIELGQCVDIVWRLTGRVWTVTLFRDGVEYLSDLSTDGVNYICPGARGIVRYTLRATGPGGVSEAERLLEVR